MPFLSTIITPTKLSKLEPTLKLVMKKKTTAANLAVKSAMAGIKVAKPTKHNNNNNNNSKIKRLDLLPRKHSSSRKKSSYENDRKKKTRTEFHKPICPSTNPSAREESSITYCAPSVKKKTPEAKIEAKPSSAGVRMSKPAAVGCSKRKSNEDFEPTTLPTKKSQKDEKKKSKERMTEPISYTINPPVRERSSCYETVSHFRHFLREDNFEEYFVLCKLLPGVSFKFTKTAHGYMKIRCLDTSIRRDLKGFDIKLYPVGNEKKRLYKSKKTKLNDILLIEPKHIERFPSLRYKLTAHKR